MRVSEMLLASAFVNPKGFYRYRLLTMVIWRMGVVVMLEGFMAKTAIACVSNDRYSLNATTTAVSQWNVMGNAPATSMATFVLID